MISSQMRWLAAAAYVFSIVLGNVFVSVFGIGTVQLFNTHAPEHVYMSLTFPLGAMWIGLTFSFRDFVQRFWGHKRCWLWMLMATCITYMFNADVAVASVVSFVASEAIDWGVFYLLRHRSFKTRLIVSNLVSCPVDSLLFVTIAFGVPWYSEAVWGQAIVKYLFGLLALPIVPQIEKMFSKLRKGDCQAGAASV